MRIAHLDLFAGISGDMLLGAFVQAGVPVESLRGTVAALKLGATLEVEEVDRSGIHAVKVHVLVDGEPADAPPHHESSHSREHHHGREARALNTIRALIDHADLPKPVKILATRTFELLGEAEARIHHVPVDSIHFHEVGAVDSIVDIVLAASAAHVLQIDAWHGTPVNVGGGTVQCAHGRFPVPAPAAADLLRGAPTYSSGIEMELVTPTGAALLRAFDCRFEPAAIMRVEKIGYGAGTRNPPGFANVLRLSIGDTEDAAGARMETISVLETALDDLNPQVIAYVTEQALALGALDVMCTPVQMKKNRPGTLITILSERKNAARLEELVFRETSTLGLRLREERRLYLDRRRVPVTTEWGPIQIKVGFWNGREVNATPEFEDCRRAAEAHAVPIKLVMEVALQAYRRK